MLDTEAIRRDFPFLREGRIYLDSTATSLTPEPVLNKMLEYYRDYRANVERGVYKASQIATDALEKARGEIARLINAKPEEIILVRNTTEGINLVASGLGLKKGDRIVTTILEHHSNFIVWLRARDRVKAEVEIIMSNDEGFLELSDFNRAINGRTRIVAVTQTSNVLGVRPPVKEIIKIAHDKGALVLLDGAQSVPHMKVDVKALGCDFLAFSGHKMCGPTGAGALYMREDLQERIEPLCIGGGTIEDVGIDYYRLRSGPTGFEAGTPAIAEVIGMGAAASYLMGIGMPNIASHEARLTKTMLNGLAEVPKLTLYGSKDPRDRAGIFSFNLGKLHPHDLAIALDATAGVMVRSGHHCALPLHKYILKAENGTVRASVSLYNTEQDVEVFLSTISEISKTML
ncbi:MAG: cysteine desulfurase [Candidatus Methanomethyliaceae archaeon]|nr:cysteine desulfurase [Candidatus Methanomethyliaceae archaeon]